MRIEPLDDRHDRTEFASGIEPLDRYFRTQVGQDVRKRVSSCFVLTTDEARGPVGFYTVAATSLMLRELPATLTKRLPRYPAVPATLMGRLAVDARHRGQGSGQLLLMDAFSRTLCNDIATFAFVVDAKDAAAATFYTSQGFLRLTITGRRMFRPMAEIARLFA